MLIKKSHWVAVVLLGVFLFQPVFAEDSGEASWQIGPGVVVSSKPYEGVSSKVYPIPFILYKSDLFEFQGISAIYQLLEIQSWSVYAQARWRFEGYESGDSFALRGMEDRDGTLDVGLGLSRIFEWGRVRVGFLADTLNRYGGYELTADYSLMFPVGQLRIAPYVGLNFQNSDLIDYYYGVRQNEVLPDRDFYRGGSAVNWFLGTGLFYDITENWRLIGGAKYEWLDSEISNSPIIEDSYRITGLLGVTYQF